MINKLSSLVSILFLPIIFGDSGHAQLAKLYPHDKGIDKDPNVLFVEMFDDTMSNILSLYDDILNSEGMLLDPDIPKGSLGPHSLKITSITNGVNNGGHLFKRFSPGFDSCIYVRYYVKYPVGSKGYFHHESIWFGGYIPSTSWPDPRAGICGLGDKRLSIAFEPVWHNTDPPGMDTYLYWGDMHSHNNGKNCYGNVMITQGATGYGQGPVPGTYPVVTFDEWMCVEVMVKLNTPATAHNGELAIWINGRKVGNWGPGYPNGHWQKDKWYNNPEEAPFKGFRWRTNPDLIINWLWIEFYHDDVNAPSSYIKYDHIIVAKKYIGPISL